MKKSDVRKRVAEEVQSGLRGFIQSMLGDADHLPNGDIRINQWTVKRWKKVMKTTHFKLPPQQKVWATQVADNIIKAITNMKKKETKSPQDPRVPMLKEKFIEYCKNIKGFEPILNHGRDTEMLKERLASYDEEKILDCFDWFLGHDDYKKFSTSISTCLSANIFNKFLSER